MNVQPHDFNKGIRKTLRNAMHGKPCPRCYTPMKADGKSFECVNPVCSRHGLKVRPAK